MYNIIHDFVTNESENGLILVDMPTGSGKTYAAMQYIHDACLLPKNSDKKFIFVTSLLKNLTVDDLRKLFEKEGQLDLFEEKVLVARSLRDGFIEGWSEDLKIPDVVKRMDGNASSYATFVKYIEYLKSGDKELRSEIEKGFDEKERVFRKNVIKYLEQDRSVDAKIKRIKTDEKFSWIGKLYPTVFMKEKQIIFMSMQKAVMPFNTIVEPAYYLYNSDVLNHAVLFVDEFDATKATLLSVIINGTRQSMEYVELFRLIHDSVQSNTLSKELLTQHESRRDEDDLEKLVENVRRNAEEIKERYALQFRHKTRKEDTELDKNYLFHDHQFRTIWKNKSKTKIVIRKNESLQLNEICAVDSKQGEDESIQHLLRDVRNFIVYFEKAVYVLAVNHCNGSRMIKKDTDVPTTMEMAVRSVLHCWLNGDQYIEPLAEEILLRNSPKKVSKEEFRDLSFYENGFRYYTFVNGEDHDQQSRIMMNEYQVTPEKLMLKFCERAKVIGISATASLPSAIGNYDLGWLKMKLGKAYVEVTHEQRERLAQDFEQKQSGYCNVRIHAELLGERTSGSASFAAENWCTVFDDAELAEECHGRVMQILGDDTNSAYLLHRYHRIALAYRRFMECDVRSFLCLLNMFPSDKKELNEELLKQIFTWIGLEHPGVTADYVVLKSEGFEKNKGDLQERLCAGEKLFILSTYATLGAGQNMNYDIPDDLMSELVRINELRTSGQKDFDAIYLDRPTNLLVNPKRGMSEEELALYLYQLEYLQENGELARDEVIEGVRYGFDCKSMVHSYKKGLRLHERESVRLQATRTIIQAVGRICRTENKNKDIYVFADVNICDCLDPSIVKGGIYNRELLELADAVEGRVGTLDHSMRSVNKEKLKSVHANALIQNLLHYVWSEKKMEIWKNIRAALLVHPTASTEEARESGLYYNYYVQFPGVGNRYYYHQEQDYEDIQIAFEKDPQCDRVVDEAAAKLPELLKIQGVRALFEKNGWAVEFKKQEYILSPALFNNIYKGVLGEVVGSFLFESVLHIQLEEIDDPKLFELFDFKVPSKPVYVDFKNWHAGQTVDRDEVLEKIADKAIVCKAKAVVIANVLDGGEPELNVVQGVKILSVPKMAEGDMPYAHALKEISDLISSVEEGA